MIMTGKVLIGIVLTALAIMAIVGIGALVNVLVQTNIHSGTPNVIEDGPKYVPRNPDFALSSPYGRLTYVGERTVTLCDVTVEGSMYSNGVADVLIDSTGQVVYGINRL
jgi:hypothetical protein